MTPQTKDLHGFFIHLKASMRFRYLILTILALLIAGIAYSLIKRDAVAKSVGAEFHDIALAMANHSQAHGDLPPAINWSDLDPPTPLCSWRLNISTFLEGFGYPGCDYHSSWDSELNSDLHGMPTALALTFRRNDNPENFAKVYAVTGQDTAFGPATSKSISWSPNELPADVIIAIEVAGSKKHWMEPGDYNIDTIRSEILSEHGEFLPGEVSNRFHVIFADFQVWALSTKTPFEKLKPFLTKTGALTYDRDELLKPNRLAAYNDGG